MNINTMKAVVYTQYGPPEVLKLTEVDRPSPKSNELLVRVHASTVTPGTIWLRTGRFPGSILFTLVIRLLYGLIRPKRPILGVEFSGVVEQIGDKVTRFHKGDEVYGTTTGLKQGSYAEYVCIPERWKQGVVAKKPRNLAFGEAAALPVGGMTAWQLLRKVNIQQGQHVLIYGASGSVGSYTVQLAKYLGARVTAVCSTGNMEMMASIGADEVIDYTRTDASHYGKAFDAIVDAVGKLPYPARKSLLKRNTRFASVRGVTNEKPEYLDSLHRVIEAGQLVPVIDRVYPIAQIAEAHSYVERGRKKGNVVLHNATQTGGIPQRGDGT